MTRLSLKQHEVLKYLIEHDPIQIEDFAQNEKLDKRAAIGIAKRLESSKGNFESLSKKQMFYYIKCISPLLEQIACKGIYGHETCTGNGIVDEESLLLSYIQEIYVCQLCRFDQDRHNT